MRIKSIRSVCLLCCILFILLIAIPVASRYHQTHESNDKLAYYAFKDMFTEPVEVMYFLMYDMKLYKITSNEEHRVSFNLRDLKKLFGNDGYDFTDVILIIHNHQMVRYFSFQDADVYRRFMEEGFTGNFYMYNELNRKLYILRWHDKW